ncbi:TIR domain-containing protein [Variovorax robiniae]|uniref:TIR domain-containing protein n=1 Tax=Variovorax robiniae TaxID=1836199 RepID=A0ABU8XM05_9BURK
MDPLRLYVVFDPGFRQGLEWARFLTLAFSAVGMQREEVRVGVPVQWRWKPWDSADADGMPLPIDLAHAAQNVVIVLVDDNLIAVPGWSTWMKRLRESMARRGAIDSIVPVQLAGAIPDWVCTLNMLNLGRDAAPGDQRARTQFRVRLLNIILAQRKRSNDDTVSGHGIFLSHAKRDAKAAAESFVTRLNDAKDNLGVRYFYDAISLLASDDYEERFVRAIKSGSLLAIVTDAYHTRPWCRWEILTAKEHGRPVVVVDMSRDRIERTYPYLANVPSIRLPVSDPDDLSEADIESVLLALLSEALRVELWRDKAIEHQKEIPSAHIAVRPPELADLAVLPAAREDGEIAMLLYPDPPLSSEETQLLRRARPGLVLVTPTQLGGVVSGGGKPRSMDGRLVAISVSDTSRQDLERLGLAVFDDPEDESHQDITDAVLRALLTPLIVAGARVAYGGRIEAAHNFTHVIYGQLGVAYRRVGRQQAARPFVNFQPAARVLQAPEKEKGALAHHLRTLAPYGEVWTTHAGRVVGRFAAAEGEEGSLLTYRVGESRPAVVRDEDELQVTTLWHEIDALQPPRNAAALTDMREQMARDCDARILVGGRVAGFSGEVPGLVEEALLTLTARRPLLILGGFGGISRDIAASLGLIDDRFRTPRQPQEYVEKGRDYRAKVEAGLDQLRKQRSAFEAMYSAQELDQLRELASTTSLNALGVGVGRVLSSRLAA